MDRLALALCRDEVVKGVDLGVEHVEKGLTTDAILAGERLVARLSRQVHCSEARAPALFPRTCSGVRPGSRMKPGKFQQISPKTSSIR